MTMYKDQHEIIERLMDKLVRSYAHTKDTQLKDVLRDVLTALARRLSDLEKERVYH